MKTLGNPRAFGKNHQSGFTLLEVLIAIFVFSIGLLGVASMMSVAIRNNHNGYLRTQANFLVNSMIDRMHVNQVGLWTNNYDSIAVTGGPMPSGGLGCDDLSSTCDASQLAARDAAAWAVSIGQLLPAGAQGTVQCNTPPMPFLITAGSNWVPVPSYTGTCAVTVSWNESNEQGLQAQTVTMTVTP